MLPNLQQKGGGVRGIHSYIPYLCIGKCSWLLYLQMAGQRLGSNSLNGVAYRK